MHVKNCCQGMERCNLITYGLFATIVYVVYIIYKKISARRQLNRWKKTPKNIVILHGVPRAKAVPSGSPFALKLETFLRMANISYKLDTTDGFGPRGKTPWISINGEHFTDSQLIIQYLSKKFDVNLNGNYSDEKLAIGTAVRVMFEEHMFWGFVRATFVDETRHEATKHLTFKYPRWIILYLIRRTYSGYLWSQGLGRLSSQEVHGFMTKELKAFATILGNNKFLLGDEPSEVDASIFGFASQLIWGLGTGLKQYDFVRQEHPNIVAYCERMKAKYWADWENCLA